MELTGRYLTAAVTNGAARRLFGLPDPPASADGHWTFSGRVEGETAGVGIWLRTEEVATPEGMVMPAPGPYTLLVRWEWVIAAVLTADKPPALPPMPIGSSAGSAA